MSSRARRHGGRGAMPPCRVLLPATLTEPPSCPTLNMPSDGLVRDRGGGTAPACLPRSRSSGLRRTLGSLATSAGLLTAFVGAVTDAGIGYGGRPGGTPTRTVSGFATDSVRG